MALPKLCSIEGCDKEVRARGWCCNHYALWERNGAVIYRPRRVRSKFCQVDGCEKLSGWMGYCSRHAWRLHRHGSTDKPPSKRKLLAAHCSVNGCEAPPERGRKGMCARHYRMLYRRGTTVGLISPRGEPERWLREHVEHQGDECLIWPFARTRDGVGRLGKKVGAGAIETAQAPRAMCALAHGGPPEPYFQAAHKCGNGHHGCVNPQHLEWKRPLDNTWDKERHGTMLRGERHPMARLTDLQARAIRELGSSFTVPELVDLFGGSAWTISDIVTGRRWACPG